MGLKWIRIGGATVRERNKLVHIFVEFSRNLGLMGILSRVMGIICRLWCPPS